MPLDIVVPDLLPAPDAPPAMRDARLPRLERWLARADIATAKLDGAHAWISAEHALAIPPPYAAIALEGEGREADGAWLRADPVHLRIDQDGVVLHDAAILGVTPDEARSLVASLQAHFAGDGLELHAMAPDRWYARVPPGELPSTVPLERAIGRNIFGMLPRGAGRINWPSALTEAQMTLSSHDANADRAIAVNSIWVWGEGMRPATIARRYDAIYASDPFCRGLARLSGAQSHAVPRALGELSGNGTALVLVDALTNAVRRADASAWLEAAAMLDREWFEGAGEAIGRFGSIRIVLPSDGRTLVATLTPQARWRWFRARKPIGAHA